MNERRAIPRHKVFKAGSIEFDGTGIDCTVHNLSQIGAGIEVASPFGIPHEVTLNIPTQHVRQHGYIVWRKENRMGITFA
jgi:hypothetical protein